LLCTLVLLVAACGGEPSESGPPSTGTTGEEGDSPEPEQEDDSGMAEESEPQETDPDEDTDSGPEPAPEVAEPYEPLPGEMRPNAKRLAARVVEGLTNYEAGDHPNEIVAAVADGPLAEDLVRDASVLFHEDAWSRGEIVYPQLGGMLDDETSVMVVVDQVVGLPDGTVLEESRTMDVRLDLHQGEWALSELASAGGEPVERPDDLPAEAQAVLDDERIELPDSAVWDIHRGEVDRQLLVLMARMADQTPYGVVVLDTGHPWEIFGTDRQSKHSMGKAVDIHRLDEDDPWVIEDRQEGSATHEFVRWIYEQPELSEVGSPWALDGFGGRSFSDPLHQDHLHVGVGDR
jgi:hypothetical protein